MILSYAKVFNKKMREKFVKVWKKRKKHVSDFSTFSIADMKKKKSILLV